MLFQGDQADSLVQSGLTGYSGSKVTPPRERASVGARLSVCQSSFSGQLIMSLLERLNPGYGFRRYFRIDAALDDERRDNVYHIRREVHCEELKHEPERRDRCPIDEYDTHSMHCLLRQANHPAQTRSKAPG